MDEHPILQVRGVTKSYGDTVALRDINFDVHRGEIVGLIGPNGAGKTTLMSIVAGLRRPDSGSVRIDGIDVWPNPRTSQALLGYAPQDLGIYPVLTVAENLALFGQLAGLAGAKLSTRVEDTAQALQLEHLLDRRARTLSGGEKRRLHTAAAVIGRAPLLLLDEPTANADVQTRRALLEAVRSLAADGSSIVYSTHYFPEVEDLGASIVIIDRGLIIARGSLDEVVGQHGRAAVDISFRGQLPSDLQDRNQLTTDNRLRVVSDTPSETGVMLMQELLARGVDVVGLDIVRPSLEAAYMHLTGRRYTSVLVVEDGDQ